ncbi:MAG: hypothetical protein WCO11_12185 [Sphingomonadales bacterium]
MNYQNIFRHLERLDRSGSADHLIGEVSLRSPLSSCIYFDNIELPIDFSTIIDLFECWFSRFYETPKVLIVDKVDGSRLKRVSIKSLRVALNRDPNLQKNIESIQIFPRGRNTIDNTWRPSIYCAISMSPNASAFICVNEDLSHIQILEYLLGVSAKLNCAVSYGFWFPAVFSPLGYYWGVSVDPVCRSNGNWASEKSERIANWKYNSRQLSVNNIDNRDVPKINDLTRDVYPITIFNKSYDFKIFGEIFAHPSSELRPPGMFHYFDDSIVWIICSQELQLAQEFSDRIEANLSVKRF